MASVLHTGITALIASAACITLTAVITRAILWLGKGEETIAFFYALTIVQASLYIFMTFHPNLFGANLFLIAAMLVLTTLLNILVLTGAMYVKEVDATISGCFINAFLWYLVSCSVAGMLTLLITLITVLVQGFTR
jgi:hypothetical protein